MEVQFCLLYIAIAIISATYFFIKYKFSYWKKLGVPFIEPNIPYGNMRIKNKVHHSELTTDFYHEFKHQAPFGGAYFLTRPVAIICDLDLVKNILIKDFQNFTDRGIYYNEKDDPLSAHMFSVDGPKWKRLRTKLTPTFTSGRMKFMYPTVLEVAQKFQLTLQDVIKTQPDIEIKDILARFTTDVIGSCAFGIECNSLNDPDAEFRVMGRKIFEPRMSSLKRAILTGNRTIARLLRFKTTPQDISDFFINIVRQTVEHREKNNIKRNDFMDLLIQLKNSDNLDNLSETKMSCLSLEEIASQAFLFFIAGFETSSSLMAYCLYELSLHQEIQDKLRVEINKVIKKYNGDFPYEAMREMTYLDQVINETLRKYPPVSNLMRSAVRDYRVPDSNLVIEKGTSVWIPAHAIHHDPEIYPNPDAFDPDRFSPENVQSRHACSFLSFGDGPRNCVGLRFGMVQTRVGLVTLLKNFKFSKCSQTQVPLIFSTKHFILTPESGLYINVQTL